MAAVAASAVTILETWYIGGASGRKFKGVRATIVLSSQGSTTNPIPATVFDGLKIIEWSSTIAQSDDSNQYSTVRSYDGTNLYVVGGTHNTADISGTFKFVVFGRY